MWLKCHTVKLVKLWIGEVGGEVLFLQAVQRSGGRYIQHVDIHSSEKEVYGFTLEWPCLTQ